MSFQNSKEKLEIERIVSAIHQIDYAYVAEQDILNSYTFSEKFYQRMNHMVSRHEKREMWIRIEKMSAAVVTVLFLLWNLYHPQYVKAIYQKFFQWYENHVEFSGEEKKSAEEKLIGQMEMTYLLEGMEVEENYSDAYGGYIKCNGDVYFSYGFNDGIMDVNNEEVDFYIMSDGENEIWCFESADRKRMSHIVWYLDDGRVVCTISGYRTIQELLLIKNGIVEKN